MTATTIRAKRNHLQARMRRNFHALVLDQMKKSGTSIDTMAERLDEPVRTIRDWLASPLGWSIERASDCLFALDGSALNLFEPLPERFWVDRGMF